MREGQHLLHYRLLEPIGEGGMGQVWRAADTTLGRDVAIKVLPAAFASDPERLLRFEREAKVLASLNHPNIAGIHGFHASEGLPFLVMELVPGEGLDARIARGALPLEEARAIAIAIAVALEYAHDRGVVHRDLKPANVRITPDGTVKVLDFGLAKAMVGEHSGAGPASTPTILPTVTSAGTAAGMILGTAAYMSPEQARGKPVDKRADIWAFGAVAVEMLTGRRLFDGETASDSLAAVLTRPVELHGMPHAALWARCLDRDPRSRLRDIGEARIALERRETPPTAGPGRSARRGWVVTGCLALAALALGVYGGRFTARGPEKPHRRLQLELAPPEGTTFDTESSGHAVLSPDGRKIVFAALTEGSAAIWIRSLDGPGAVRLPAEVGGYEPFWSPDGSALGIFNANHLVVANPESLGPPVVLAPIEDGRGGTWSARGVILYAPAPQGPLYRIPASGGPPEPATRLDAERGEIAHIRPQFLPDGEHFLYYAVNRRPGESAVMVGALDSDLAHRVVPLDGPARFAPPDRLLYLRGTTLVSRAFDPGTFAVQGEPRTLAENVGNDGEFLNPLFSVSSAGIVSFHETSASGQPRWFDRAGRPGERAGASGDRNLDLSPDGRYLALEAADPRTRERDIWVTDLERGVRSRLAAVPGDEIGPVFSADGRTLYYTSRREGMARLEARLASGVGEAREILRAGDFAEPIAAFPGGRRLLVETRPSPERRTDLEIVDLETGARQPFVATPANEGSGRISPDGQFVAYESDISGTAQIFVEPVASTGERWQVSAKGGSAPRWRGDGRELYFVEGGRQVVAVTVTPGPPLEFGAPEPLFRSGTLDYVVSRDGQRFLAVAPPDAETSRPIRILVED